MLQTRAHLEPANDGFPCWVCQGGLEGWYEVVADLRDGCLPWLCDEHHKDFADKSYRLHVKKERR